MATTKTKDPYLYFLYSEQQKKERVATEKKMSKTFSPGTVIINGVRKQFTELSKKGINSRYPDCKIVAEGLKSMMTYTDIVVK